MNRRQPDNRLPLLGNQHFFAGGNPVERCRKCFFASNSPMASIEGYSKRLINQQPSEQQVGSQARQTKRSLRARGPPRRNLLTPRYVAHSV